MADDLADAELAVVRVGVGGVLPGWRMGGRQGPGQRVSTSRVPCGVPSQPLHKCNLSGRIPPHTHTRMHTLQTLFAYPDAAFVDMAASLNLSVDAVLADAELSALLLGGAISPSVVPYQALGSGSQAQLPTLANREVAPRTDQLRLQTDRLQVRSSVRTSGQGTTSHKEVVSGSSTRTSAQASGWVGGP
jgi:hypothetical protein